MSDCKTFYVYPTMIDGLRASIAWVNSNPRYRRRVGYPQYEATSMLARMERVGAYHCYREGVMSARVVFQFMLKVSNLTCETDTRRLASSGAYNLNDQMNNRF